MKRRLATLLLATTAGTSAATAPKKAAIGLELPAGAKPAAATPGMVWLHPKTNSYRCPGDPQYGQGRDGMLLKETEVEQNGARPQMGKRCW